MGCDIHLYVETKNSEGKWESVKIPYQGWAGGEKYHDGLRGWSNRCYDTFAILANVRNGRGFAGVVTGEGFNPISEPRGLPSDISDVLNPANNEDEDGGRKDDSPWLGDHSFSWLTYAEVADCDWTQTSVKSGVVDPIEYMRFRADGSPNEWCGMVSGQKVRHITNRQMDDYVDSYRVRDALLIRVGEWATASVDPDREQHRDSDRVRCERAMADYARWRVGDRQRRQAEMKSGTLFGGTFVPSELDEVGASFYTQVKWTVTYRRAADGFLAWLDEVVKPLADAHGRDNVRLVFGFDS